MAVLAALLLCGVMCIFVKVEASTHTIGEQLKPAALSYPGTLKCSKWDCNCTFTRQRGCCCAANDMYSLEDETFTRMLNLYYRISELGEKVEECTAAKKIAFKATIKPNIAVAMPGTSDQCFGPFNSNVPIPYGTVALNDGNGYNPALGTFTAPRSGVYMFSITVYSSVSNGQRLYHKVQLMKNGVLLTGVWENNREDSEDSATQVVIVQLNAGCQVYVELVSGRKLCTSLELNIFTGHILYAL